MAEAAALNMTTKAVEENTVLATGIDQPHAGQGRQTVPRGIAKRLQRRLVQTVNDFQRLHQTPMNRIA